jgi:hypothetical protein
MYILHFLSAYAVGFTFRYANIRPSAFLLAFEFVANVFLAYWSAGFTERVVEGKGIKLGRKMIGILDRPTAATSSDRLLRCE